MIDRISQAAAAYATAATRGEATGMEARRPAPGESFADMVRDMVGDTVNAMHQSERVSGDALVGRADLNDVVMAVNNAEMGLQTVVGIRDRIIEAYQDIMRMPI